MTIVTAASTTTGQPLSSKGRAELPALDGLRGCAVLLVVAVHLQIAVTSLGPPGFPGVLHTLAGFGYVGVQLFFVLSGFLLFQPYAQALLAWPNATWPSARQFYVRRARRILPLYYVAVGLLLLAHYRDWPSLPPLLAPLYLIAFLLHDMRADATSIMYVIDGPLWSLAAEWQFYLVLPVLALGIRSLVAKIAPASRLYWVAGALILLMAAGLGARYAAGVAHYDWGYTYPQEVPGAIGFAFKFIYGFRGKYIEEFALGMLASMLHVVLTAKRQVWGLIPQRVGQMCWLFGILGLGANIVWAASSGRIDMQGLEWFFPAPAYRLWAVIGEWSVALCFALLLLGVLVGPSVLRRAFTTRWLRFVGIISFSIYVWHFPILFALVPLVNWARAYGPQWAVAPFYCVVALAIVGVVSTLSYRFIERPFLHRRLW